MKNLPKTDYVRPDGATVLSDDWGTLTRHTYALRRRDGTWQDQQREVYDRGHGAVCLLHNLERDTVLLTRQFRLPVFTTGEDGFMIEAPAGLLEGAEPGVRMKAELEEETGYAVSDLTHLYNVYMSPGSVNEYLAFFTGTYTDADAVSDGGGEIDEGEDIEVLHIPLSKALDMIAAGEIRDAKTIMLVQHLALSRVRGS